MSDKKEVIEAEVVEAKNEVVETKAPAVKRTSTTKIVETATREVMDNVSDFINDIDLGNDKANFALKTGAAFVKAATSYALEAQKELDKLKAAQDKSDKNIIDALQTRLDAAKLMINEGELTLEKKEKYYDDITEITAEIVAREDSKKKIRDEEIVKKEKNKNIATTAAWTIGGMTLGGLALWAIQKIAKSIK